MQHTQTVGMGINSLFQRNNARPAGSVSVKGELKTEAWNSLKGSGNQRD
ncbi:hypothetical protein [Citrobacter sp. NCU1]|nr:hypothetical protein [Citrobacter sp. NCU1]